MTEPLVKKLSPQAAPHLESEEQILDMAIVQPTLGASGGGFGLTAAVATAVARAGAVTGAPGSIADSFPSALPYARRGLICVTDRRVLFVLEDPTRKAPKLLWQAPRSYVIGVERRPRLQVMAKFRLHFVDGSSASLLTMRRRSIESLASVLGRSGQT